MSMDGPPASGSMPHVPQAPSLVGQVLAGRYRITRKLGEGGMGEVYAAEHVHIEKRFAIKLLRPEIVSNPEAVSRFRQEARSSSSIGHRNIIAIEDFGDLPDGRIYMCMELLNGAALNDLITTPQPLERLLNILIQTGHGLAAAHAKGIVHRDMKPENIFVTIGPNNEDIPKLLDFGIAKVAGNEGGNNLTRTGTIFGTPFYMAPEQALGNPVDARTDIYAMGVIMYEVFAGSLPFQGEQFMAILTQHITTEPEPVARRAEKAGRPLPPALAEVITRCMRKDPNQRFSTMDELVAALVEIYRGVAGAGMSTYMEAFPGARATPGPMSRSHAPITGSPPVGTATPNPMHAAPATAPTAASASGVYAGDSAVVAPAKGSKTGLLLALLAVLLVGGGVAAFVVFGDKPSDKPGDGSAVAGGPGSDRVGSANDVVVPATPDAAGATPDAAMVAAIDAGPIDAPAVVDVPVDAAPVAAKTVQVLIRTNLAAFEAWEGSKKLFDGPDNLEIPEGGERKITLKAKGYKDKAVTVSAKDRKPKFTMTRLPGSNTNPGSGNPLPNNGNPTNPNPQSKCTGTKADLQIPACRDAYCQKTTDPKERNLCDLQ